MVSPLTILLDESNWSVDAVNDYATFALTQGSHRKRVVSELRMIVAPGSRADLECAIYFVSTVSYVGLNL